jgi:3-oxoacyl-[acyl-carrier-protein] synthase-1
MTAIVITGMGAVTSVGRSALAACAAIRARISRPRKLGYFHVVSDETQEEVGLSGHPLKGFTEGFNLVGRWLRLAQGCMEDMLGAAGAPEAKDARFWARTGLVGVLPIPEDLLPRHDEDAARLTDLTLRPLRAGLELAVPERHLEVVTRGHVGMAVALERGLLTLSEGTLERLLVVAADSYLTPVSLTRLSQERRLKTEAQPVGLMPGEAGVCFLLETEAGARRRGAPVLARVAAATTGKESPPGQGRRLFPGIALADCIQRALERASASSPFDGDFHVDLNGEPWRAQHWGSTLVRLRPSLAEPHVHLAASAVGDTGAASGALGLCLASYGLTWGHARTRHSLVVSCSEDGAVGCVAVQAAEGVAGSPFMRQEASR